MNSVLRFKFWLFSGDQIKLITLGDQSVLAKSFIAGKIDGTYLSYGYRPVLKEVKHRNS
jgi:hypothetical protein